MSMSRDGQIIKAMRRCKAMGFECRVKYVEFKRGYLKRYVVQGTEYTPQGFIKFMNKFGVKP